MSRFERLKARLRHPFHFKVIDAHTFQERYGLRATLGRLSALVLGSHFFVVVATALLIFYTPVREWIPGYIDSDYKVKQEQLLTKLRYLEDKTARQDSFINALQRASGYTPPDTAADGTDAEVSLGVQNEPVATETATPFRPVRAAAVATRPALEPQRLLWPVRGTVSKRFDEKGRHYALDIATAEYSTVHAVAEGFVILTEYSALTGHVIGVEHPSGLISFYKHNQRLLKNLGEFVFAGEAIARVGNTGRHTTGPHLHLEFWLGGKPVDPLLYLRQPN